MKQKRQILFNFLAMLIWMAVIFSFSQQNGESSQSLSNHLLALLGLEGEMASFILRKLAHWTEYLILAFLTARFVISAGLSPRWILIWVIMFAFLDEFHQSFIAGRVASLWDVGVDTFGGLVGYWLFSKK